MADARLVSQSVSVDDIRVEALIGVHAHERLHRQSLNISVTLIIDPPLSDDLTATVDYNLIVDECRALADEGISLIETFVHRLAHKLIGCAGVRRAEVRVEKRGALANGIAGAAIVLERDQNQPAPR